MFPSLPSAVENEVRGYISETRFHEQDADENLDNSYETSIMAHFICINGKCAKSTWGSGKVAIRIRSYPGNAYNAVVFNQRCKSCNALGKININTETYVSRVAYRLKKWAGIDMKRPPFYNRETPPHESQLCEGCKAGYCQWGRD